MSVGKWVGVREWVGVSVCAGENRQAGGRASLELGEGLGFGELQEVSVVAGGLTTGQALT